MHVVPSHAASWEGFADPQWERVRRREILSRASGSSTEFLVDLVDVAAGARVPEHACWQAQIDYVIAGRGRTRIAKEEVELEPGACIYHAPAAPRILEAVGPGPLRFLRVFACERVPQPLQAASPHRAAAARSSIALEHRMEWRAVEPNKRLGIRVKRLLDRGAEVMAGVGEIDPGMHYTRHYHDQPEIYFILSGSGVLLGRDSETEIGPGSAAYLASREVHGVDNLGNTPLRLFWVFGCESAGHDVNWTPVEAVYERAHLRLAPR